MDKPALKTYDKIVQESLALFNHHGERNITTNHIAAHLGISPGNLYYHFRNKEEIIYQIFLQYKDFMNSRLALNDTHDLNADDMVNYLDTAFLGMWQFRFLFYDLPGLLARNPQLQSEYYRFVHCELRLMLVRLFREFNTIGLFSIEDADIEPIVVNMWLVVKFWFAFEQTAHPQQPITEETSRRGVLQVLALLKPYIQAVFMPAFEEMRLRYSVPETI